MSQAQYQEARTVEASHIDHAQLLRLGKMLLLLVEQGEPPLTSRPVTDLNKKILPIEELGRAS